MKDSFWIVMISIKISKVLLKTVNKYSSNLSNGQNSKRKP